MAPFSMPFSGPSVYVLLLIGPFKVPNLDRLSVTSASSACSGVRLRVTRVLFF